MSPLRGGILSGITLSGQRENNAGVRVKPQMNADERRSEKELIRVYLCSSAAKFLQRSAAGKSCVDVVPPFEFVAFAELPAQ